MIPKSDVNRRRMRYILFRLSFLLPALLIYTFILLIPIVDSMRLSLNTGSGLIPNEFMGWQTIRRSSPKRCSESGYGAHSPTTLSFSSLLLYCKTSLDSLSPSPLPDLLRVLPSCVSSASSPQRSQFLLSGLCFGRCSIPFGGS